MFKKVLGGTFLLIIAIVAFYFTASSSRESESQSHQLIEFENPAQRVPDTLVAMTYNIGYLSGMTNNRAVPRTQALYEENLKQAQYLLATLAPDVIGFQEIDYASNRSFEVNQLTELADAGRFSHALKSINWDKRYVPFPYWPPKHHFGKMLSGQSIATHGELTQDRVVTLPKPINAPFYYKAFYLDRLVQLADWKVGGTTIKVLNVHLEAFDQETRIAHAEAVKQLYDLYAQTMPVLLLGDFNSPPAIKEGRDGMDIIMSAENIASAITDASYQANPAAYHTFSSGAPTEMIDYILYNPSHIIPIAAYVPDAGEVSDHLPVVFEFQLKDQAP